MRKKIKIIIAAGGTGGHLYPAIALGEELKERDCEILYVIRSHPMAEVALQKANFKFVSIHASPFFGKNIFEKFFGAVKNGLALLESIKILSDFKAKCVVGFGAYVSVPMILAAYLKRIPVVIHEQNMEPGWANRFCARFSKITALSFKESKKYFPEKSVVTGNLVRREFFLAQNKSQAEIRKSFGLKENLKTILIFGGSAGSKSINQAASAAWEELPELKDSIQLLHISGSPAESEKLRRIYNQNSIHAVVLDYAHQIADCYRAADMVICRSGATTITELISLSKPSLLIPYPHAIGDHQFKNAALLETIGAALVLRESDQLKQEITSKLQHLFSSGIHLVNMKNAFSRLNLNMSESSKLLADLILKS